MVKARAAIDKKLKKHPKMSSGKPESRDDVHEDVTVDQGSNKLGHASSLSSLRVAIKKKMNIRSNGKLESCEDDLAANACNKIRELIKLEGEKVKKRKLEPCDDDLAAEGDIIEQELTKLIEEKSRAAESVYMKQMSKFKRGYSYHGRKMFIDIPEHLVGYVRSIMKGGKVVPLNSTWNRATGICRIYIRLPGSYKLKEWGFEKLLFRDSRTRIRRDRKYAIQAENAYATGVHMSENVVGGTLHKTETKIRYYHYHNTITVHEELCRNLLPDTAKRATTWLDKIPCVYDDSMKKLAPVVKKFERDAIGIESQ